MNNCVLFTLPGSENMGASLQQLLQAEAGAAVIRSFPDGETYIKVLSDVYGREAIIVCTLNNPDQKILPLFLLAKTLKEFGATTITLIAAYLAYMRQDKRFSYGECMSADLFAQMLSTFVNQLITLDPHLHQKKSLAELYPIHTASIQVTPLLIRWIKSHIQNPLIVGPDAESEFWVKRIADEIKVPFFLFDKKRKNDDEVMILNEITNNYEEYTPVIVDDIISTGATMKEAVVRLVNSGMKAPVCIGIHAVFARGAYEKLIKAGADKIITCNTIAHATNEISIDGLLAAEICKNSFVV